MHYRTRPKGIPYEFMTGERNSKGIYSVKDLKIVKDTNKGRSLYGRSNRKGLLIPLFGALVSRDYMHRYQNTKRRGRGGFFLDFGTVSGQELIFDGYPGSLRVADYLFWAGAFCNEATRDSKEKYNCMLVLLDKELYSDMPAYDCMPECRYLPFIEVMCTIPKQWTELLVFYGKSTGDDDVDKLQEGYLAEHNTTDHRPPGKSPIICHTCQIT